MPGAFVVQDENNFAPGVVSQSQTSKEIRDAPIQVSVSAGSEPKKVYRYRWWSMSTGIGSIGSSIGN